MRSSILLLTTLTTLAYSVAIPRIPFNIINMILRLPPSALPTACDVSLVNQPVAPTPLPPPASHLKLSTIAIGRGTQNFTCATSTSSSVPTPNGAIATLYDGSCIASRSPSTSARFTAELHKVPLDSIPSQLPSSGHHYFPDSTTPAFDMLNTVLGITRLKKGASSPAPANQNGDVPWLQLISQVEGTTGKTGQIYRLNTASGTPPTTCEGMAATFEVQYAAEYWFYAAK